METIVADKVNRIIKKNKKLRRRIRRYLRGPKTQPQPSPENQEETTKPQPFVPNPFTNPLCQSQPEPLLQCSRVNPRPIIQVLNFQIKDKLCTDTQPIKLRILRDYRQIIVDFIRKDVKWKLKIPMMNNIQQLKIHGVRGTIYTKFREFLLSKGVEKRGKIDFVPNITIRFNQTRFKYDQQKHSVREIVEYFRGLVPKIDVAQTATLPIHLNPLYQISATNLKSKESREDKKLEQIDEDEKEATEARKKASEDLVQDLVPFYILIDAQDIPKQVDDDAKSVNKKEKYHCPLIWCRESFTNLRVFHKHAHSHPQFDANGVAPNKKGQFPYESGAMSMIALMTHHYPVQLKYALKASRQKYNIQATRIRDIYNQDSNKQKKQERKQRDNRSQNNDNKSENQSQIREPKKRGRKKLNLQSQLKQKSEKSDKSQVKQQQ